MIRKKTLKPVEQSLTKHDVTMMNRKRVIRLLGFERDCLSWRKSLIGFCHENGITAYIGNQRVVFLKKPNGDAGVALDLLMETCLQSNDN